MAKETKKKPRNLTVALGKKDSDIEKFLDEISLATGITRSTIVKTAIRQYRDEIKHTGTLKIVIDPSLASSLDIAPEHPSLSQKQYTVPETQADEQVTVNESKTSQNAPLSTNEHEGEKTSSKPIHTKGDEKKIQVTNDIFKGMLKAGIKTK